MGCRPVGHITRFTHRMNSGQATRRSDFLLRQVNRSARAAALRIHGKGAGGLNRVSGPTTSGGHNTDRPECGLIATRHHLYCMASMAFRHA